MTHKEIHTFTIRFSQDALSQKAKKIWLSWKAQDPLEPGFSKKHVLEAIVLLDDYLQGKTQEDDERLENIQHGVHQLGRTQQQVLTILESGGVHIASTDHQHQIPEQNTPASKKNTLTRHKLNAAINI